VGAGPVGAEKFGVLAAAGAEISVVSPELSEAFASLNTGSATIHQRPFEDSDLDGAFLVVSAAPPAVNQQVLRAAEKRGLFVNAADDKEAATAYLGGVVRRSGITLAISTNGAAPALAGLLRQGLEALLPKELDLWMGKAAELRTLWKSEAGRLPFAERRPALLRALNRLYGACDRRECSPFAGADAPGSSQ